MLSGELSDNESPDLESLSQRFIENANSTGYSTSQQKVQTHHLERHAEHSLLSHVLENLQK